MALSDQDKKVIKEIIRQEVPKLLEELFSRSLRQVREFFIKNII